MKANHYIKNYRLGRFTLFLVAAACLWVLGQNPNILSLSNSSHEYRDLLANKMDTLSLQYFIDTSTDGECSLVIYENNEPQALIEYADNSDLACQKLISYIKSPTKTDQ